MLSGKMPKHRNVLKKSTHWIENRPAGTIEKKAERKVFMEIQITQKQCGGIVPVRPCIIFALDTQFLVFDFRNMI